VAARSSAATLVDVTSVDGAGADDAGVDGSGADDAGVDGAGVDGAGADGAADDGAIAASGVVVAFPSLAPDEHADALSNNVAIAPSMTLGAMSSK
jgi:hypothetical protein